MWREAQRIKTENTPAKRTKSAATIAYPLRNILVCGCGKPMKGKAAGAGRPAYYICNDRKHFGPERCNRPVLKKPVVETAVWNFLRGLLGNPAAVIDYVREARERLREQPPAGRQALAEKKQALMDVKARLARYHERFERAANAGEEDFAWERIKELRQHENTLKGEIAELEAQQVPRGDRELDVGRARRYLRTLARFFRSRPRYEESLYEALHQHHHFRVAVLAKDLVEATLEFDREIEPFEEEGSMSRDWPMYTGGGQPDHIGRRVACCSRIPLESLRSEALRWLLTDEIKRTFQSANLATVPHEGDLVGLKRVSAALRLAKTTAVELNAVRRAGHRAGILQSTASANTFPKWASSASPTAHGPTAVWTAGTLGMNLVSALT